MVLHVPRAIDDGGRDEDAKSNARSVRWSSDEPSNEKSDEEKGIQSLRLGATEGECLFL